MGLAAEEPRAALDDVRAEGVRLVEAAGELGIVLRLMGGVAVQVRCPSARRPPLSRTPPDIDLAGLSRQRRAVTELFEHQGYEADKLFNALHGAQRLNFSDPVRDRPVDVIVDRFRMSHELDLRHRLQLDPLVIPVTDLLLTKLQIFELNAKDLTDLLALLGDLGGTETGALDGARLAEVTRDDWGLEHTIRRTLGLVERELAARAELPAHLPAAVRDNAAAIRTVLDHAPKSFRWRSRAMVGERVRWYELPEETRH